MKVNISSMALIALGALILGGLLLRLPASPLSAQSLHLTGGADIGGSLNVLGTKNFRIDHPLDPENQYLVHFASEGPEPFNVYAGRQMLDDSGHGWVVLPPWFEAINIDFRYQLTAIGGPALGLHIMREIEDNRFQIGGGVAGGEVSWEVRARRNDATMQRLKPAAEIDKPEHLRGSYLDPLVWDP